MALNILQAHAQVVLDLLDADNTAPALVVHNGEVPAAARPPYVVVYFVFRTPSGTDEPDKVSLEAHSDVLYTSAYCHSVGGNQYASLAVGGRVRAALRGIIPAVAGRVCGPIAFADGSPVRRDETTGVSVFDFTEVWEYVSLPA